VIPSHAMDDPGSPPSNQRLDYTIGGKRTVKKPTLPAYVANPQACSSQHKSRTN